MNKGHLHLNHPDVQKFIKILKTWGSENASADEMKRNTLSYLIKESYVTAAEELLDEMTDSELLNKEYYETSPLQTAAYYGRLSIVRKLLDRGIDPNVVSSFGVVPIMDALNKGHIDTVKLLYERGARIDNFVGKDGRPEPIEKFLLDQLTTSFRLAKVKTTLPWLIDHTPDSGLEYVHKRLKKGVVFELFKNLVKHKRKTYRNASVKELRDTLGPAPPGAIYSGFPGGPEYEEGLERALSMGMRRGGRRSLRRKTLRRTRVKSLS
jgi:hypothetical protein